MRVFEVKKMTSEDGREVYSVVMDKGMLYEMRTMLCDSLSRNVFDTRIVGKPEKRAIVKIGMLSRSWQAIDKFLTETFGEDKAPKAPVGFDDGSERDNMDPDK